MSEREPEHRDEQDTLESDFQDSGLTGEEELHASFEELEPPAPDTDPFASQDDAGDDAGDGGEDSTSGDAEGD
ncbi:MAG TPA: hypothetical protein VK038_10795 [Ornithinicoccus sp.]|nr:hypothetical protein [Ornithinicoccus sp.]